MLLQCAHQWSFTVQPLQQQQPTTPTSSSSTSSAVSISSCPVPIHRLRHWRAKTEVQNLRVNHESGEKGDRVGPPRPVSNHNFLSLFPAGNEKDSRGKELDVFFSDYISMSAKCECYFVLIDLHRNIRPCMQTTVIRQPGCNSSNNKCNVCFKRCGVFPN